MFTEVHSSSKITKPEKQLLPKYLLKSDHTVVVYEFPAPLFTAKLRDVTVSLAARRCAGARQVRAKFNRNAIAIAEAILEGTILSTHGDIGRRVGEQVQ